MSKIKSTQHSEWPEGWIKKPDPKEANYKIKLAFWKIKLSIWQDFIYHNRN